MENADANIQAQAPEVVAVVQHNHQSITIFDGTNSISFTMAFKTSQQVKDTGI